MFSPDGTLYLCKDRSRYPMRAWGSQSCTRVAETCVHISDTRQFTFPLGTLKYQQGNLGKTRSLEPAVKVTESLLRTYPYTVNKVQRRALGSMKVCFGFCYVSSSGKFGSTFLLCAWWIILFGWVFHVLKLFWLEKFLHDVLHCLFPFLWGTNLYKQAERLDARVCQLCMRQEFQHSVHILLKNGLSYTKGNTFSDFIPKYECNNSKPGLYKSCNSVNNLHHSQVAAHAAASPCTLLVSCRSGSPQNTVVWLSTRTLVTLGKQLHQQLFHSGMGGFCHQPSVEEGGTVKGLPH